MRQDLADAYLDSRWPPRDLGIIAVRLGIAEEIFSYVEDRWGGRRYLRAMFNDLNPSSSEAEKQARKHLRRFI